MNIKTFTHNSTPLPLRAGDKNSSKHITAPASKKHLGDVEMAGGAPAPANGTNSMGGVAVAFDPPHPVNGDQKAEVDSRRSLENGRSADLGETSFLANYCLLSS